MLTDAVVLCEPGAQAPGPGLCPGASGHSAPDATSSTRSQDAPPPSGLTHHGFPVPCSSLAAHARRGSPGRILPSSAKTHLGRGGESGTRLEYLGYAASPACRTISGRRTEDHAPPGHPADPAAEQPGPCALSDGIGFLLSSPPRGLTWHVKLPPRPSSLQRDPTPFA